MASASHEPHESRGIPALAPVPPVAIVVVAITSVQFGGAIAVTQLDRVGAAGLSVVRLVLGALVLLAIWRPWRRTYAPAALRLAAVFGLTLGVMNLSFYAALARLPLGVVVTIEFLGPIAVATIFSRRRRDLVWVVLALAGVVLLAAPWRSGGGLDGAGVLFALVAAVFWGLYIVLAERAGRRFDGGEGLSIAMVWAAALALVPGVVQAGSALLSPHVLLVGLAVALLSTVVPYTLETEALRRMPTAVFGVLMSVEPAVAALAGWLVLGQALSSLELVAIGLVVLASVGATRDSRAPDVFATPAAPLDA